MLTASAYQPLVVQCQPSVTEISELLSQFSVINGGSNEPRNLDDFAAVSRVISRSGLRNLAKFSAENCGPYSLAAGYKYFSLGVDVSHSLTLLNNISHSESEILGVYFCCCGLLVNCLAIRS